MGQTSLLIVSYYSNYRISGLIIVQIVVSVRHDPAKLRQKRIIIQRVLDLSYL